MTLRTNPVTQYISEKEFMTSIIEYAQAKGWRCAHFRHGMTSRIDKHGKPVWVTPVQADGKGWPDLVLVRDRSLLFCEIKSVKGKLSAAQQEWLQALSKVAYRSPKVEVHMWTPADWPTIEKVLE
jgi:hypothetical protein